MDRRLEVMAQVDDYAAGYVQREGEVLEGEWQDKWEEILRPSSDFLEERLAGGGYPHIEEFLGGERFPDVVRRMIQGSTPDERFDRGLDRLLDGVALEIDRLRERVGSAGCSPPLSPSPPAADRMTTPQATRSRSSAGPPGLT